MQRAPLFYAIALTLAGCGQPAEPGAHTAPAEVPTKGAAEPASSPDPILTAFLQDRTREAMAPLGYVARTTGEGAGALTLVYLIGPEYCGSGGCNLLILRRSADGYDVLGETTVTHAPIRVLSSRTNGLPDIGVRVSGGGITEGYEAKLAFDGTRYPSNPTVAPAERVEGAQGVTLITDEDEKTSLKS